MVYGQELLTKYVGRSNVVVNGLASGTNYIRYPYNPLL